MVKNISYFYTKDKQGNRTGHTLCVITNEEYRTFIGSALCSKADQFSRKEGRELALERAHIAFYKYVANQSVKK